VNSRDRLQISNAFLMSPATADTLRAQYVNADLSSTCLYTSGVYNNTSPEYAENTLWS